MNDRIVRVVLRTLAIAIAVVAVIDPAITTQRAERPDVVVMAEDRRDSVLVTEITRSLVRDFTVLHSAFDNAAATVVIGSHIPVGTQRISQPAFAVLPARTGADVMLASLRAPTRAPLNLRVPVSVFADVIHAKGKTVEAELSANGAVVDRISSIVTADDAHIALPLSFVPTTAGASWLRVSTRIVGSPTTSSADRVVDVTDKKFAVLVYDPRPSWMSTFVRRALERDLRFVVTSRTVTSTNVSTDAGRPPVSLGDAAALDMFDAIVIGAPDALTDRDVAGLNQFLRQRGGGVALLFDDKKDGRYASLTDVSAWVSATGSVPTIVSGDNTDSIAMRTTEWMWPARMPDNATVIAWNSHSNTDAGDKRVPRREVYNATARNSVATTTETSGNIQREQATPGRREHPLVWQVPVGAGRLLVSGALDAWKFRDPAQSGFERFWQVNVGELADESPSGVEVRLPDAPVRRGARVDIAVVARNAALAPLTSAHSVQASASAILQTPAGNQFVRVWPTGAAGAFRGSLRAPDSAGVYRVIANADGITADAPLVVSDSEPKVSMRDDTAALAAWTASGGGSAFPSGRADQLPNALRDALKPALQRVTWHPMRSPWWLLPFALALSAEWWLRRRRALA